MHIVFVNYNVFEGNSGLHIHPLANELSLLGHKVTVLLPADFPEKSTLSDTPLYAVQSFSDSNKLDIRDSIVFIAWTPREIVRKKTLRLAKEYNAPYFVHLEDNEEQIILDNLNLSREQLFAIKTKDIKNKISENISHPKKYQDFLKKAKGVTCIINTLEDFIPLNIPRLTFWPSCENDFYKIPLAPVSEVKKELQIDNDAITIFYPGNLHKSNSKEITTLYESISILNNLEKKITLIRTGKNFTDFTKKIDLKMPYFIELGEQTLANNVRYISAANFLIQPGIDNSFNRYRFPSKIPMFLASGRPLIIGDTNFGRYLKDWFNCLKFVKDDPFELAHKITLLIERPLLSQKLGENGRQFAEDTFSWQKSADKLLSFLLKTLKQETAPLIH
jgi:glycosyltransferase involved in cell wall biosynthesis